MEQRQAAEQALLEAVAFLVTAWKNLFAYPPGHPARAASLATAHLRLAAFMGVNLFPNAARLPTQLEPEDQGRGVRYRLCVIGRVWWPTKRPPILPADFTFGDPVDELRL